MSSGVSVFSLGLARLTSARAGVGVTGCFAFFAFLLLFGAGARVASSAAEAPQSAPEQERRTSAEQPQLEVVVEGHRTVPEEVEVSPVNTNILTEEYILKANVTVGHVQCGASYPCHCQ